MRPVVIYDAAGRPMRRTIGFVSEMRAEAAPRYGRLSPTYLVDAIGFQVPLQEKEESDEE
jgi:hypothetical protein